MGEKLLKHLRFGADRRLVNSKLVSYREQLRESMLHDGQHRYGLVSNRTIILRGKIELCEDLLGRDSGDLK